MTRATAVRDLLEDLELKAVLLRVATRKFARDAAILRAMQRKFAGKEISPYIRRALRARLRAQMDTEIAEQEVAESQEYYLLRSKGKAS